MSTSRDQNDSRSGTVLRMTKKTAARKEATRAKTEQQTEPVTDAIYGASRPSGIGRTSPVPVGRLLTTGHLPRNKLETKTML